MKIISKNLKKSAKQPKHPQKWPKETYKNPFSLIKGTLFTHKRGKRRVKNMAKLTAWVVTIIGILLLLPLIGINIDTMANLALTSWLITIGVLAIGISKLMRSYGKKGRR